MKTLLISLMVMLLFLHGLFRSFGQKVETLQKMKNPSIVIKKKERALQLFDGERLVKNYKIALGFAPEGDKQREGDGKTPEGEFYIFTKNDKSKYYLSLGLSYPNIEDAARGLQNELISQAEYASVAKLIGEKKIPSQYTKLGGEIYIHGGGSENDWTEGCIALADKEIKELFDAVEVGTTVRIEA